MENDTEITEISMLPPAFVLLATSGTVLNASRMRVEVTSTGSQTNAIETFTALGSVSTYKIQSGDTLRKSASQKGVSPDALLETNPDADLRRLNIGKEINIPAK